jgi:hypothetical protein
MQKSKNLKSPFIQCWEEPCVLETTAQESNNISVNKPTRKVSRDINVSTGHLVLLKLVDGDERV